MQHANSPLTPKGRHRMVLLVEEEDFTFEAAAAASNVAGSTCWEWVRRWREAGEEQRLINQTYSAFVQGFMPTLARPEVDVLDGLTTAILVDQERIGADARSTVGTATDAQRDAAHPLQPARAAADRFAQRVLLQRPTVKASGAITIERGAKKTVKATFTRTGLRRHLTEALAGRLLLSKGADICVHDHVHCVHGEDRPGARATQQPQQAA